LPSKIWQTLRVALRWTNVGEVFFIFAKKVAMTTWDEELLELLNVHIQKFGIIHLSNSDLIYIRNPERET
jgi:hypothetical protein